MFNIMIMVLFGTVVYFHSNENYKDAVSDYKSIAESYTTSLADHTELSFVVADMLIRRAIERQYMNQMFGGSLNEYTNEQFSNWLKRTPQILALSYVDEAGVLKASAEKADLEDISRYRSALLAQNISESMKSGNDKTLYIGAYTTRERQNIIVLSRRYVRPDGNYSGYVVVALDPRYFTDYYHASPTSDTPYMQIRNGNTLLATSLQIPEGYEPGNVRQEFIAITTQMAAAGETVKAVTLQGRETVIATRELKSMPITVSVMLGEREILRSWQSSRDKDIGFLTLFIVFGTVISFFAIAMSRHITRAEQSENSAILASQAKSDFLANMSHELRTPLNAVIGFSEMLNSEYFGPLNAKQKERVHDINLCGTHLLQLINDILEFSKGDAGKLELSEEKVDIAEVINETTRITNGRARMKNIRLITSIEPEVVPLWGDRRKITQTMLNLMTNAIKFTPENGTVRVSAKLDPQNALIILVSDTGIGIAEEDIPKALSVFGQVQRSQSHEGTGLGLPLCKMFIELHGGRLSLTSKLGAGTTVKIQFPHQRSLINGNTVKPLSDETV